MEGKFEEEVADLRILFILEWGWCQGLFNSGSGTPA